MAERVTYVGCLSVLLLCVAGEGRALAQQDVVSFYKDRNVTLIVSTGAGGGYDLLARTIARHLNRHIPGNPSIIVQNMPGGGALVATNHLYSIAAKDGTVFAGLSNNTPFEPLFGAKEARYDAAKFNWLGRLVASGHHLERQGLGIGQQPVAVHGDAIAFS